LTQKNHILTQQEGVLREENTQLQKRLRELLDANKEVTTNYQAIKKNHDAKRKEFEEILAELEEAKNACQLAIRQKKAAQSELTATTTAKNEAIDKYKTLERQIEQIEKELTNAQVKLTDTIADYEAKLERKDEQIWAMGAQLNECTLFA
jgi:chromosome segregation ATPase